MFKKNKGQLTIGEHLIYQNLPDDILSRINKLIDGNLSKKAWPLSTPLRSVARPITSS